MKYPATRLFFVPALVLLLSASCYREPDPTAIRQPVDTVGFAQYTWQVDSFLARVERLQAAPLEEANLVFPDRETLFRLAISPHDDYSYVGYLYPALLQHVRPEVVIMLGVAHKAKDLGLEDQLVFGTHKAWKSPAGTVPVSRLREKLIEQLPQEIYTVNDSMENVEHSLEAIVPFLEHYRPGIRIIPILVPYMSYERMEYIANHLAPAIRQVMSEAGLEWGKGFSILISTDAVHYGNEDWGGKDYSRFGTDTAGYLDAVAFEEQLIRECISGELRPSRIKTFTQYTVQQEDYHEYKWTWCGRYSVPFGMLTALRLSELEGASLDGKLLGYSTSIAHPFIPVDDLGMGHTAPAKLSHWVGYAAIGFE